MNPRALMLSCFALLLLGGCSSFNREWKEAAQLPAQGVEGRWIGRWHSDYNQHEGPLRCLITRKDGEIYHTRFHAKYKLGFLTVGYPYDMDMAISQDGKTYSFKGEANLGRLAGGVYRYDGNGTITRIDMNYRASKDFGTFKLERPKESK
ncbi:MAG: hypothetical protein QF406_01075 [Verrucomicrobiota bacterium]|nr:hypothetical protein [Verrucomicrobiota bacterium]